MFDCRLTSDFHTNKRIIDHIAVIQTKRLRNKIAGFTTHLMKRIAVGPVRGISLRLQEEVSPFDPVCWTRRPLLIRALALTFLFIIIGT